MKLKQHFRVVELNNYHYYTNYLQLLNQLSPINIGCFTYEMFTNFVQKLNVDHKVFVIEDTNTNFVAGSVTILIEHKLIHNGGKVGHIEDVVVDAQYRGGGLGKKLMEIAKAYCSDCYKIVLNCNDNNISFYKKCNFIQKENQMVLYTNIIGF